MAIERRSALPSAAHLKRPLAQAVTFAFTPPLMLLIGSALVVVQSVADPWQRVKWESLAALIGFAIPVAIAVTGVRLGFIGDLHMADRRERLVPELITSACALASLAALIATGAPAPLTGMIAVLAGWLIAITALTLAWKVSNHCGSLAAIVVTLALALGPDWLAALLLLLPVGWARLQLGSHSIAELVAGAAAGAAVAALAYELALRLV